MNTHQMTVSSQNNNRPHSLISGIQHDSYALETDSNPLIIPEAEAYNSPATGALPLQYTVPNQGMRNNCNPTSSSQYMSELRQEIVSNSSHSLNNDYGDPGWNPSQLNGISNFPPSTNS
ncbi:hypothetical protein Q3G72_005057 [Acer saccharum]|nr:hypothetical protein Q3G72_005057 [Acer saccharum]